MLKLTPIPGTNSVYNKTTRIVFTADTLEAYGKLTSDWKHVIKLDSQSIKLLKKLGMKFRDGRRYLYQKSLEGSIIFKNLPDKPRGWWDIVDIVNEIFMVLWEHGTVCSDEDIRCYFQIYSCDNLDEKEYEKAYEEKIKLLIAMKSVYVWGDTDSYVNLVKSQKKYVNGKNVKCISAIERCMGTVPTENFRDVERLELLEYDVNDYGRYDDDIFDIEACNDPKCECRNVERASYIGVTSVEVVNLRTQDEPRVSNRTLFTD